jgi:hypothetical protein
VKEYYTGQNSCFFYVAREMAVIAGYNAASGIVLSIQAFVLPFNDLVIFNLDMNLLGPSYVSSRSDIDRLPIGFERDPGHCEFSDFF